MQTAFLYRDLDESASDKLTDFLAQQDWVGDLGRMDSENVLWRYFIAEDDPCLMHESTLVPIKPFSQKVPLLFFVTTDEFVCEAFEEEESYFSGWGFRIFHQGEEKARVEFSDRWPSYGEGLKSHLDAALAGLDTSLFELFSLGEQRQKELVKLLDSVELFNRLDDSDTLEDIERSFTRLLDIEINFLWPE